MNQRNASLPFISLRGKWKESKGLSELKWFSLQPYFKLFYYQNKLKYRQSSELYPSLRTETPLDVGWQVLQVVNGCKDKRPEYRAQSFWQWKLPHCTNYILALCFLCSWWQMRCFSMNHMKGILSVVNGKCKMCAKSIAEGTHQILRILQVWR